MAVGSVTQVITQQGGGQQTNVALGTMAITPTATDTTITISVGLGKTTVYTLRAGFTVNINGSSSTLGALAKGDAVALLLAPDGSVSTIDARNLSAGASLQNQIYITYGTPLDNSQLSGTASTTGPNPVPVAGTFSYTTAAGTVLNAGNGQTEGVTFTPTDSTDYTTATSTVTVNVAPGGSYGDGDGCRRHLYRIPIPRDWNRDRRGRGRHLGTPTFTYYLASDTTFSNPLPGAPTDVGNYVVVASTAASANYAVGAAKTSFTITPAATATAITITSSQNPACLRAADPPYTATVTNTSGTPAVPVGSVQFVVDGVNSGSSGDS